MPLDFLSEVIPAHTILSSLIHYGTAYYSSVLGSHGLFSSHFANVQGGKILKVKPQN